MLERNTGKLMPRAKALALICLIASIVGCKSKSPKVEQITDFRTATVRTMQSESDESEGLRLRPMDEVAQRMSGYSSVYFDFDASQIRQDQIIALEGTAKMLEERPTERLIVEGHCDERGTVEYNLLLGERRAIAVKSFLVSMGDIRADRLQTISKGEEEPAVMGHDESAWAKNRRVEFIRAE